MENRKLAAILAADLVGYSRLAGEDEERTLIRLRSLRSEFLDPTIAVHNGRVVKRIGDGLLLEFRSVVDATRCALEIQRGLADRNAAVGPERQFRFRIGIHIGDVVEEADGDLMGDGVNIAARLEGIAKPGAICLSEDAYRQVRNRLAMSIDDLGLNRLKNIAEPVRVFSVGVEGEARQPKPLAPRAVAPWAAGAAVAALALACGVIFALRPASPPTVTASVPPTKTPASTATLAAANAARDEGAYARAITLYSELAAKGDVDAQWRLGQIYRDGLGTPADATRAAEWFRKAADQGQPWAQGNLADFYWRGMGVDRDYAQALRWAQKSADQGNPLGQNVLGLLYDKGWGVSRDYALAMQWYRKAADQNFGYGISNAGFLYLGGKGVPRDYEEATRWFKRAADLDNPGGEEGLGIVYRDGLGVARDPEEAFRWFKKAADHGLDWAEVNLAVMMRSPEHRDYPEARRLLKHSAAQGNPNAMNLLGVMYQHGEGGPADPNQAFDWYSRAASYGFFWGMVNLADLYARGAGVTKDCEQAKSWLSKAMLTDGAKEIAAYLKTYPICDFTPANP